MFWGLRGYFTSSRYYFLDYYLNFFTLKFKKNCPNVGNRKILIYKVFIFAEIT